MERTAVMADFRIALLGFGRLGRRIAERIDRSAAIVGVFDSAFARPGSDPAGALRACTVEEFASARGAVAEARLTIAAVPAEAALEAARSIASAIEPGAFFLDLAAANGRIAARAETCIARAGGRYVGGTLVRSVGTPPLILLRGRHAPVLSQLLERIGLAGVAMPIEMRTLAANDRLSESRVVVPFEHVRRAAATRARRAAELGARPRELIA
ncbi:MAG: NAD(P)-binding domain-containing protein, partial [Sphingomonas sp.]